MSNYSKRYSPEFKAQAIKLCEEKGVYYTHQELGVSTKSLYGWIEKGKSSFNTTNTVPNQELLKQIKQQAKEIARLKEEREILKKAAIFFAHEEKK